MIFQYIWREKSARNHDNNKPHLFQPWRPITPTTRGHISGSTQSPAPHPPAVVSIYHVDSTAGGCGAAFYVLAKIMTIIIKLGTSPSIWPVSSEVRLMTTVCQPPDDLRTIFMYRMGLGLSFLLYTRISTALFIRLWTIDTSHHRGKEAPYLPPRLSSPVE